MTPLSLQPTPLAPLALFLTYMHLSFSHQLSAVSKSCYYHIRELRCTRPYLDFKTASTIATSIVHSKLDYCNSLYQRWCFTTMRYTNPRLTFYHNLPNYQLNRLQQLLLVLLLRLISRLTSSFTCKLICVIITTLIIHRSLLQSFTLGSKPTFSTNPSYLNTSSTLDCFHDHGTGPDLSCFSIHF